MRDYTILHLTTSGLAEGSKVLAITTQSGTSFIDAGNVNLEDKAAHIHKQSGFLRHYAAAHKAGSLISLEQALMALNWRGVLVLVQGKRFVSRFISNIEQCDCVDVNRLVDLDLLPKPSDAIRYLETELVNHYAVALASRR